MNNKKITAIIIIVVLILIAIGVGGYFFWDSYKVEQEYQKLASDVTVETETTIDSPSTETSTVKKPKNPINFKKLHKTNSEIVAWIKVPDTNINYPILQSLKDDSYYLHRDIYGNYKYAGSVFMEYCNNSDFLDRVTLVYGHNMINGSMFADLHKFSDTDFFNKHEKFYVYTPDRKLTYQIVSSYVYDDRHIMNSFNFAEDDVFEEYLSYLQNPRSLTKNVRKNVDHKLTVDDHIVTLSTCLNSGQGRYLLQGVLIKDESTG